LRNGWSGGDDLAKHEELPWRGVVLITRGLLEIGRAVGLKYSAGFTRPVPSMLTAASMVARLVQQRLRSRRAADLEQENADRDHAGREQAPGAEWLAQETRADQRGDDHAGLTQRRDRGHGR
jgi:hypothetical protein